MTAAEYVQLHPWWTLVYLVVAGLLAIGFAEAVRGGK